MMQQSILPWIIILFPLGEYRLDGTRADRSLDGEPLRRERKVKFDRLLGLVEHNHSIVLAVPFLGCLVHFKRRAGEKWKPRRDALPRRAGDQATPVPDIPAIRISFFKHRYELPFLTFHDIRSSAAYFQRQYCTGFRRTIENIEAELGDIFDDDRGGRCG